MFSDICIWLWQVQWISNWVNASQRTSDVDIWHFLWCQSKPTVEQTSELPVFWNPVKYLWRQCNGIELTVFFQCRLMSLYEWNGLSAGKVWLADTTWPFFMLIKKNLGIWHSGKIEHFHYLWTFYNWICSYIINSYNARNQICSWQVERSHPSILRSKVGWSPYYQYEFLELWRIYSKTNYQGFFIKSFQFTREICTTISISLVFLLGHVALTAITGNIILVP